MTAKEIREAAEHYYSLADKRLDCVLMADYILSTVHEDDDEPVDEAAIGEYGFTWDDEEEALCLEHNGDIYEMHQRGTGWKLYWSEIESWPKLITTRSQFRSLMKGLGIERKQP